MRCSMNIGKVMRMALVLLVIVTTVQAASFSALMKKAKEKTSKRHAK